jgi:cysteine/glycine-rich protein
MFTKEDGEVCNKKITPANANEYENKLYCKQCFTTGGFAQKQRNVKWTKKEGSSSAVASKFGGGGVKCTVCDKTVYAAETVQFEKKPYHPQCFKCTHCDQKISSPSGAAIFEDKIYCVKHFKELGLNKKQTQVRKTGETKTNALSSKFGGGGTKCKVCGKTVYPAEMLKYEGQAYHSQCFKCEEEGCGKKLTPSTAEFHKGTGSVRCKPCFQAAGLHRAENTM